MRLDDTHFLCDTSPVKWLLWGRQRTVRFWGSPSGKLPFCVRPLGGRFKFTDGFPNPDIAGTPTTAGLEPSAKVRFRVRAWEGRHAFALKIDFKNVGQSANSGPAAYWRVGLPKDRGRIS